MLMLNCITWKGYRLNLDFNQVNQVPKLKIVGIANVIMDGKNVEF